MVRKIAVSAFSPRKWKMQRFIVELNMLYSWSQIFLRALNGRALVRMIRMRSMNNFRCNTVDLPHRGVLVGFIFLSSKPHRHRPELPEGASSEGCSPADFVNLSCCLHLAKAMLWVYSQKMFLFCGQYIRTVAMPELFANRLKKSSNFEQLDSWRWTPTCYNS